jgi:hypothetical protein
MAWDQRVPLTKDGTLCTYVYLGEGGIPAGSRYGREPIEWKDKFEWEGVLTLEGMTRGRSAARFIWRDYKDRKFEMFMADMVELVKSGACIENGCCGAKWTFTKKGANYGIKVVA